MRPSVKLTFLAFRALTRAPRTIAFRVPTVQTFPRRMKVLLDHHLPFSLAHGGMPHQIIQMKTALESAGVEVEYLRWWETAQHGDIIHFFGRPAPDYVGFAHGLGCKVVLAELLNATGSRSRAQLAFQKMAIAVLRKMLPKTFATRLAWESYQLADACVALTPWEANLMIYLFDAPPERVHVVPNGVEEIFLNSSKAERGQWLVCTTTITERKRVLELARSAVHAQTPLWIIGKAYADTDAYAREFLTLARQHPQIIRYEGAVADRTQLARCYREARGFVLLSAMESLSLSALEAAACECPLLLSDLPWARGTFRENASYCPVASPERTAEFLKKFYAAAPMLPPPPRPATWAEIGRQLKTIYERLPATSR